MLFAAIGHEAAAKNRFKPLGLLMYPVEAGPLNAACITGTAGVKRLTSFDPSHMDADYRLPSAPQHLASFFFLGLHQGENRTGDVTTDISKVLDASGTGSRVTYLL